MEKRLLKKGLRFLFYPLFGAGIAIVAGWIAMNAFFPQERLRNQLETSLSALLSRSLTIEVAQWRVFPRPVLVVTNVRLLEADSTEIAYCPAVRVRCSLMKLLRKEIVMKDIDFEGLLGTLRVNTDGNLNLFQLIQDVRRPQKRQKKGKKKRNISIRFGRFRVSDGRLKFIDERVRPGPFKAILRVNAFGDLQEGPSGKLFPFHLEAVVDDPPQKGNFSLRGQLGGGGRVAIAAESLPIAFLADYVPSFKTLTGKLAGTGFLRKAGTEWRWNAQGKIDSLRPVASREDFAVNSTFQLSSRSTSTIRLEFRGAQTRVDVRARIPHILKKFLDVSLSGTTLDFGKLLAFVRILTGVEEGRTSKPLEKSFLKSWNMTGRGKIEKVHFRGELFRDLTFHLEQQPDQALRVRDLFVKGLNGNLTLEAAWDPKKVRLRWKARHIDMAKVARILNMEQRFTGKGRTDGEIEANRHRFDWTGVSGWVTAEMKEGYVWGVPGLLKTFSMLNMKSFVRKIRGRAQKGWPYQRAKLDLIINQGVVTLKTPALFESRTLQVAFRGGMDMNQKTVDGQIVFNFLTVLDEVVGAIPGVNIILLGDKKSVVPIWVRVKGPLKNPTLSLLQAKTVASPLWNTFQRVLFLPKNLIRKIFGSDESQKP